MKLKWSKTKEISRADYNDVFTFEVWKQDEHEWRTTIFFHCDGFDLPNSFKTKEEAKTVCVKYFESILKQKGRK
jgi:hypothetical protein